MSGWPDLNRRPFGPESASHLLTPFPNFLNSSLSYHGARDYVKKDFPRFPALSLRFESEKVTQQVTVRSGVVACSSHTEQPGRCDQRKAVEASRARISSLSQTGP